ncbi:glycosyltransferase family 2 protein [Anatilimnocola sp. NA78]|uniref:glycosyltransferase family 2 protein n=1 Tax=Anatilimnocola sp. NA78 TaxID=3415683 RepID=UPI003CE4AD02
MAADGRYAQLERVLGSDACRQLGIFPIPPEFLLSVVVPVYNEQGTIEHLIAKVRQVPLPLELIIVDDCSTDRTAAILQQYEHDDDVRIVRHQVNRGKGAALRTGFEHIRGTVVVVQDADLEYDPSEYPRLVQPIIEGKADAVFGSRFLGGGPHRVLYFWHYLGNCVLTTLSNAFTNLNLTDMETCYKVMRADVLKSLVPDLKQNRFGFEPEITARLARAGARIYEVSISYSGRTYQEGKKIGWKDGVQAIWCILRYGLGR